MGNKIRFSDDAIQQVTIFMAMTISEWCPQVDVKTFVSDELLITLLSKKNRNFHVLVQFWGNEFDFMLDEDDNANRLFLVFHDDFFAPSEMIVRRFAVDMALDLIKVETDY